MVLPQGSLGLSLAANLVGQIESTAVPRPALTSNPLLTLSTGYQHFTSPGKISDRVLLEKLVSNIRRVGL